MTQEHCSEFERKPYTPFFTCKRCGQRRHDEPVICLKQPTQFEKSLKQRQEVWGYFKNGAPGIDADGPYILDKRDVWYMRHESEQHAGYAWQEHGKTFIPVDLCFICNTLSDIEVLYECPVCFAPVCCDCSCGCNEPGYDADAIDFSPTASRSEGADPRNDKNWVERECKKIEGGWVTFNNGSRYKVGTATSNTGRRQPFDEPVTIEDLNRVRQNFLESEPRFYESVSSMGLAIESDLVWDVVCEQCRKVWHLPQPKGSVVGFDFLCDCGNPMSFTAGEL